MMFKQKTIQKIGILALLVLMAVFCELPDAQIQQAYLVFACLIEIFFILSIGLYSFGFSILYFILSAGFLLVVTVQKSNSSSDNAVNYYLNLAVYLFMGYLAYFTIRSTEEESHGNITFISEEEENLLLRRKELERMKERKKVLEDQTRHLQYLSGMLNQAWSLTSFDDLTNFFVRQTSKLFDNVPVVFSLKDRDLNKGFRSMVMKGVESGDSERTVTNIPEIVSESKKPFLIEDLDKEINYKIVWNQKAVKTFSSVMAVPIMINEHLSGVLECYHPKTEGFNNNTLRILQYIGEMIAILLLNAKLFEETEKLARTDGITGMFVQHYFIEKIQEEIFRANKQNSKFALMIVDIDDFKVFNDTYGHQVGDFVLIKTARLISTDMRTIDFASRYGGDEFFIILPETDLEGARQAAERIRRKVSDETQYMTYDGKKIERNITISIGVDEYKPAYGDYKKFIDRVDQNLYAAKRTGKNRVVAGSENGT